VGGNSNARHAAQAMTRAAVDGQTVLSRPARHRAGHRALGPQQRLSYAGATAKNLPLTPALHTHHNLPQRPTKKLVDRRLFIRLDQASTFRSLRPHELRLGAQDVLPADIKSKFVQIGRSGLAIFPASGTSGAVTQAHDSACHHTPAITMANNQQSYSTRRQQRRARCRDSNGIQHHP
jgi:hypothetical protein